MVGGRRLRLGLLAGAAVATSLVTAASASAMGNVHFVRVMDRCDPASFQAQGIDCQDRGFAKTISFNALINALVQKQHAHAWRFAPKEMMVSAGDAVRFKNTGGETHTVTRVAKFA